MDNLHDISGVISQTGSVAGQADTCGQISGSVSDTLAVTGEGSAEQRQTVKGSSAIRVPISGSITVGKKQFSELRFLPRDEFPDTGRIHILYVDTAGNVLFYWNGAAYIQIAGTSIDSRIRIKTRAEWDSQVELLSEPDVFYIYSDYRRYNGYNIPAIKLGDGNAYLIDIPFFDTGVTEADREFWNNKVSAKIDPYDLEKLILHTD